MKPIHQIVFEPYLTEKSSAFMLDEKAGAFKYAFKVAIDASKIEIKDAIEQRFEVEVDTVNTVLVRGKRKRVRYQIGKKPNWKKAYIKLKPGHSISDFEGA